MCATALPVPRAGKPLSRTSLPSIASLSRSRTTGTLVNTDELRRQLIELGVPFLSNSDSEVATKLIGYFTQRTGHLREGIRKTMELVRGGYAMTLINEQALYAFRDPHGIRPLVLGKLVDEGLDQADAAAVSQLPSQDGRRDGRLRRPCHARRRLGRCFRDLRTRHRGCRVRP